jgi:CRP/FNR family transcriptional regulator
MKLETYFQQNELITYKKGDIILHPEQTPRDIFYIEKGHVRVYSLTEWGDEKLFVIYKAAELFPLFWFFDLVPLKRFYEALDEVQVRRVSKENFLSFLKNHPEELLELSNKLISIFDVLINRIDSLEFTNAYARLISRLIYLAQRFGEKQKDAILITIPIHQKDIASSIALTRETTSREFKKLEEKGLVGYKNHLIVINDIEALKKEMSSHYDKELL